MGVNSTCPFCGRNNDANAATGDNPAPPQPGDVSICWGCHGVGVFTGSHIRKPTPEEEIEFSNDPDIADVLMVVKKSVAPREAVDLLRHARRWEQQIGDEHVG